MKAADSDVVMVSARVPGSLAREIKLYALKNGLSIQHIIREALEKRISRTRPAAK